MTDTTARSSRRRATRALTNASLTCAAALSAAAGIGMLGGSWASADHIPYEIDTLGDPFMVSDTGSRQIPTPGPIMNSVGQVILNQTRYADDGTPTGQVAWFFGANGLERIGLFDGEFESDHTSSVGTNLLQSSNVLQINNLGYAAGTAIRYEGGDTQTGQSAWVYFHDSTATNKNTRVGLFDDTLDSFGASHSTTSGGQISTIVKLNADGGVAGNSERFKGTSSFGYSAFIQNPGDSEATRIGLGIENNSDPITLEHRRSDGFQFSQVKQFNDLGDAAGISNRYSGANAVGETAWLRTANGNIQKIGFTDPEHTHLNTSKVSSIVALNNNSEAVGHSNRYEGSFQQRGQTAWLHRGGEADPVRLGFYDTTHTSGNGPTGTKHSEVQKLNDAGYAIGFSRRYSGTTVNGQSAWMYSSAGDVERVGLTDDEHTGAGTAPLQLQSSTAVLLNNVGHVAGTSNRFTAANVAAGQSAWRHSQGTSPSVPIGLFDGTEATDHTHPGNGEQFSTVVAMNDAGQVVGHSRRYIDPMPAGETNWGQSAWISDGVNNTRIGLFGVADANEHTSSDGYHFSEVKFLNDDGHAAGISHRFNNNAEATPFGQSGWYYDGTTNYELAFSTSSIHGTFTDIKFLSDDGIALGFYTQYAPDGSEAGNHAFLWDHNQLPANRFHDLGLLVEGGLSASGWDSLNDVLDMSDLGHILGVGTLTDTAGGGTMPYLLTPVPEPASAVLLAMTGIALLPRRRRR